MEGASLAREELQKNLSKNILVSSKKTYNDNIQSLQCWDYRCAKPAYHSAPLNIQ